MKDELWAFCFCIRGAGLLDLSQDAGKYVSTVSKITTLSYADIMTFQPSLQLISLWVVSPDDTAAFGADHPGSQKGQYLEMDKPLILLFSCYE